jgi:hypothetical protein
MVLLRFSTQAIVVAALLMAQAPGDTLAGRALTEPPPPVTRSVEDIDAQPPERPGGAVASGGLREAIARHGAASKTVVVEVAHDVSPERAEGAVLAAGGAIRGRVGGVIEATVPLARLDKLEAAPGVRYVRPPLRASVALDAPSPLVFTGEEIVETNADAWHAAGYLGAGAKVGIIDFFDGDLWTAAQAAGEVPAPAGTFCRLFGTVCNVFDPALGDSHGIAVSEIVHEMAPDAQIYIAFAWTTSDTQAAVDYFASQGVDVISRSLTSTYDGPGDGTGPLDSVVDSAVAQGMVWVNSAGNSASASGTSNGSYWRGGWNDTDADDFMNFNGTDEVLDFYCGFLNGLRWNDWAAGATDYDVYIFDTPADVATFTPKYTSLNDQGSGFDPLEIIDEGPACSPGADLDHLAIHLWDPGGGTAGDVIELMGNQTTFEYSQNPYSATGPATDSASPGMMAAGAMSSNRIDIATYSSQGPTNDNRIKPDLAAASCVDSYVYQPGCFAGTSAAAPGVAGATALIIGARLATDPGSARTWLLANGTVDRGAVGPDSVYGAGELVLPVPPPDGDGDAVTDTGDNCPDWYNPSQVLPAWPVPGDDPDCDGFTTAAETTIGTDPAQQCPVGGAPDAWPPDFDHSGLIEVTDVLTLKPVFFMPDPDPRYDIIPDGIVDVTDVLALKPFFFVSCS